MEKKYTGRTYEELLKVKVADMTGEEYEFFKEKKTTRKPGKFFSFISGGIEKMQRGYENTIDEHEKLAEERAARLRRDEEINEKLEEIRREMKEKKM